MVEKASGRAVFKHILGRSFTAEEIPQVLHSFKDRKYFSQFFEKNLALTKKAMKSAVKRDTLVIQASGHLDELDKVINILAKRLREWYELYNPEFSRSIGAHDKFSELIQKKSKKELMKEIHLTESMGAEFASEDVNAMLKLAKLIGEAYKEKAEQEKYLEKLMQEVCPNLTAVAGVSVGSKLLSRAGSLERLSMMTASTVQLLGAEKALFRHMMNRGLPPKYGVIHEHPFIQQAEKAAHGKIARRLADKISIASKVDYFKGKFIGDKLRKDLEDGLRIRRLRL